jgi:PAS domain S-box-containing protein
VKKQLSSVTQEHAMQNSDNEKLTAELIIVYSELAFQNKEKEKRAAELTVANKELAFQNKEKEKRAGELAIATKKLSFENEEKENRAAELMVANKELAFQNNEKEKRAEELTVANKELAFQNNEKEKRAAELIVANQELAFQNKEKENRTEELIIANKELAFQNEEKHKRAEELLIANKELAFLNTEQQTLFASIVNSSDDAMMSKTLDGIITSWNHGAEKIFGYTTNEIIGKHVFIMIPPQLQHEEVEILKKIRNGETVIHYETKRIKKDGTVFNASLTISPIRNFEGMIIGASKILRDITERINTAAEIARINKENETTLNRINDAVFSLDTQWRYTFLNEASIDSKAYSKTDLIGKVIWEVIPQLKQTALCDKYHEAMYTGTVQEIETYLAYKNIWVSSYIYPSNEGITVFTKDITERKFAELQLNQLNENLQKQSKELFLSNAELEQFAFVASHDLQEPLRMITSFLTQLQKKYGDVIDDKGKRYIAFAVDGAKRMREIILDLLEFSRVGRISDENKEALNLNDLLDEIKILLRKKIEDKKATIIIDPMPQIHNYRLQLRQIFQNLISNALEYSRKEIPVQIHITVTELTEHWQFAVIDNGIGIAKEYFDKIFIIFQRLHAKGEYSGTGIGLAIIKKIVETQSGKIWVESEEGKGSTFNFTIKK